MRYVKIFSIAPMKRKDGSATVIAEMAFVSPAEKAVLLARAGLPEDAQVVPRIVLRERLDRGIQPVALSLDGRNAHGVIEPYCKVSGNVLRHVQAALEAARVKPTGYGWGMPRKASPAIEGNERRTSNE